jgi:hypothetical protein
LPLSPFVFFFFVELAPLLQLHLGKRETKRKNANVIMYYVHLYGYTILHGL